MLVVTLARRILDEGGSLGQGGSLCERGFAPSVRTARVPLLRESHASPVSKDFAFLVTIRKMHVLCFQQVADRLAPERKLTHALSCACALFCKNARGRGVMRSSKTLALPQSNLGMRPLVAPRPTARVRTRRTIGRGEAAPAFGGFTRPKRRGYVGLGKRRTACATAYAVGSGKSGWPVTHWNSVAERGCSDVALLERYGRLRATNDVG